MKYLRHDLHGLLVVDKPSGMTSMGVVRRVRRAAGHCKTGHAGTLDPLATGVLICCLGRATRRVPELMNLPKVYEAAADLSAFTTTDDAEGQRQQVVVLNPPAEAQVSSTLRQLTGEIQQVPPAYSAIKLGGQRAYKLARRGDTVELPARTVRIDRIELIQYHWPMLRIVVWCGKGTYIRSLARQIGQLLDTGGYLTALRRTAIGPYSVDSAWPLEKIPAPLEPGHLTEAEA